MKLQARAKVIAILVMPFVIALVAFFTISSSNVREINDSLPIVNKNRLDELSVRVDALEGELTSIVQAIYDTKISVNSLINQQVDSEGALAKVDGTIIEVSQTITALQKTISELRTDVQNLASNRGQASVGDEVDIKDLE